MTDLLLFGAFPYLALALTLVVSIQRYRRDGFTVTSLSSEFLESRWLFWGSVPFHLGILVLFLGHLVGFLIPREVMVWNSSPLRLLILESTALTAGILTLTGLAILVVRRARDARLRAVTSPVDLMVYVILLFQIVTGLWIALGLRWGSAWYTQALVPYLRSIFTLRPDIKVMADLPLIVRLHVLGAFTLFSTFSATRLVHMLVAPIPYLWRSVQVVIWNKRRPLSAR
ncbi:MAG: respiratory nitrate reductase subunit gamma [Byssovorax sp.]